jgi:predicted dehydrogenase
MEVLIIGLGSISAKHIIALRSLYENVKIYALRSGSGNDVEGITNIYNLDDLNIKPMFVIISNPTHLHLESIRSVIKLNVPIFIEKPPAHVLNGVNEIIEEIKKNNITTYVACNMRFHPCIKFLKNYFENNTCRINEVNIYCGSYLPDWRPGRDYKEIYSANKDMGGGVHLDLFHEMDYACWLFGFPASYNGFISNKSSLGIDAADYANYLLQYAGFNTSIVLNYYRKTPKRLMEILFDTETWVIDLLNNAIISETGSEVFQSPGFEIINTYVEQMEYFVDCVTNNKVPMNSFQNAIETLQVSLKNG